MTVPAGFYEKERCDAVDWTFVRGSIFTEEYVAQYDALNTGLEASFFTIPDHYPKWTLYGGPLPTMRDATAFDFTVRQWAKRNGYVWFPDETACVLPEYVFGWPWEGFRWNWVWEGQNPAKVRKDYQGQWVWA